MEAGDVQRLIESMAGGEKLWVFWILVQWWVPTLPSLNCKSSKLYLNYLFKDGQHILLIKWVYNSSMKLNSQPQKYSHVTLRFFFLKTFPLSACSCPAPESTAHWQTGGKIPYPLCPLPTNVSVEHMCIRQGRRLWRGYKDKKHMILIFQVVAGKTYDENTHAPDTGQLPISVLMR